MLARQEAGAKVGRGGRAMWQAAQLMTALGGGGLPRQGATI